MAALQEISIKVSFFSTQNSLLPDRYSQTPIRSDFTEERQGVLAQKGKPEKSLGFEAKVA